MFDIVESSVGDIKTVNLLGRIDGVSAEEINKFLSDYLDRGNRRIVLDLEKANYISSAGLRVLLTNQQKVISAGGEIMLYNVPDAIKEILQISGFLKLFKLLKDEKELSSEFKSKENIRVQKIEIDDIKFEYSKLSDRKSTVSAIGDISKIKNSQYSEGDLNKLNAKQNKYVVGLGAIGDDWDSIQNHFGESFVIASNMFVYPAIKRPAVDFMIYSNKMNDLNYSFLNAFLIDGEPSDIISFNREDIFINIADLLDKISQILEYNTYGFTIVAECKDIMGMNLRQVPILENAPKNKKSIFDEDNFFDWVNFPIEPDSYNMLSVGVGIYSNSVERRNGDLKGICTSKSKFHLHCGIFERKLMSFTTENYKDNLNTILQELQATKVQHILDGSTFSMGTLTIFNLED